MPSKSLVERISVLPDPRKSNHSTFRHELKDIIIIAIIAILCGADTWMEIAEFGRARKKWFKKFLALPNDIPSHDTFGRVFALLDADAFERCFTAWACSLGPRIENGVVALDGKSVRRSHGTGSKPLHLVSAFAAESGVVLGQRKVDGKSNEITAIPELLETLYLRGAIVTVDAMGTQAWIVRKIVENQGDYVLAVKGNQRRLLHDVKRAFEDYASHPSTARMSEEAHGREESRECSALSELDTIRDRRRWHDLRSIVRIVSRRTVDGKTSVETRYFISSLKADAKKFLRVVRAHWRIENTLHWSLDMGFREDESRARIGHAGENLALVRKFVFNLLRRNRSKLGLKAKRMKAGWDEEFLESIIQNSGA